MKETICRKTISLGSLPRDSEVVVTGAYINMQCFFSGNARVRRAHSYSFQSLFISEVSIDMQRGCDNEKWVPELQMGSWTFCHRNFSSAMGWLDRADNLWAPVTHHRRFLIVDSPKLTICRRAADAALACLIISLNFSCFAWFCYNLFLLFTSVGNKSRNLSETIICNVSFAEFDIKKESA